MAIFVDFFSSGMILMEGESVKLLLLVQGLGKTRRNCRQHAGVGR